MSLLKTAWKIYEQQLQERSKRFQHKRSLGVGPSLILNATSRCNFPCKHCLRDLNNPKDLPLEIAEKALLGIKKYNGRLAAITGGEPFVYPNIKKLIKLIVDTQLHFAIVTNGWLFKEHLDFLLKYKKNIMYVAFSLESSDKALHDSMRKTGSFDKLIENFQICRKYKIPFRTVTALSTNNYGQLLDIGIFLKKQKPAMALFTTMLPCPRTQENELVLDAEKRQKAFSTLMGLAEILKLPIVIAADIRAESNLHLCSFMKMRDISIDAEGNITHCCELAGYDSNNITNKAFVTSLKDKSFEQALEILCEHIRKSICERIKDYKTQTDIEHIDFNSCFYCVNKFIK